MCYYFDEKYLMNFDYHELKFWQIEILISLDYYKFKIDELRFWWAAVLMKPMDENSKNWVSRPGLSVPSGVNFTNILWAAFAPKSFGQKITNPNCKLIKGVQRTLVWLSISSISYKQVLCTPFMCLQFGFVNFWPKDFSAKAAH